MVRLDNVVSFFVYILRCADGSYYTGHTDNLEKRIAEHIEGTFGGYTSKRRPIELVFSQTFPTREEAFTIERRIKGWSRKKKEAMITQDWAEISRLAQSRTNQTQARSTAKQQVRSSSSKYRKARFRSS